MKLKKYFAAVSIAEANAARATSLGQLAFFALALAMYARIWQLIAQTGALVAFGRADLLLYLAVTEWIALSIPLLHVELERDVRSGNVAHLSPRPIASLWLRCCERLGTILMLTLGLFAFGVCAVLARGSGANASALPSEGPLASLCGMLTAVVAATLNVVFCALIGLSAFFAQDPSPLYRVCQKLGFVFGGLTFPFGVYPEPLQRIAYATPYPSLADAPGRVAIGAEPAFLWRATTTLAIGSALTVLCAYFVFRRARRALQPNGG